MLNRRILRIKAFKAIYSYAENPDMSLKDTESLLEQSCEAARDLYLYMLAIIGPLTREAKNRIEAAGRKFTKSDEELHPNLKFTNNRIATILDSDPDFAKLIHKKKFSWDQNDVILRHLYETIRERKYFKDYLDSGKDSLTEDAALWRKIFENEFEDNEELAPILEDMSILWNDDLAYSLICCCNTIDSLGKGNSWELPPLYRSDMDKSGSKESDKLFVSRLVRAAYAGFSKYSDLIAENTPKWDMNRICVTDRALIICGLAEGDTFPNISEKITINEYVEISKYYSTPESRGFVNGLLDKLINKH